MRKTQFVTNEYYHIFNRGVDKRDVFLNDEDIARFFQSMAEFNAIDPIGSIYENSFRLGNPVSKPGKLVKFVCYCLNSNHFHFILEQVTDRGIEKFMHRLGLGYTKYFNLKYSRSGALFQGGFKAIHINSNEYLLHLSAYVNLNNRVHSIPFGNPVSKLSLSSWEEYINNHPISFCDKEIILSQFKDSGQYKKFTESSLIDIKERKDLKKLLIE